MLVVILINIHVFVWIILASHLGSKLTIGEFENPREEVRTIEHITAEIVTIQTVRLNSFMTKLFNRDSEKKNDKARNTF